MASSIGDKIRRLRELQGLTQRDIADKTGLAAGTVATLERRPESAAHAETLARLSALFNVPATYWTCEDPATYLEAAIKRVPPRQREELARMAWHERLHYWFADVQEKYPEEYSGEALAVRLTVLEGEDLDAVLTGQLDLGEAALEILLADLNIPRECIFGWETEVDSLTWRRYERVVALAIEMGVDADRMAQLVAKELIDRNASQPS